MRPLAAVLLSLLCSAPAWAVLGQPEQSVNSDQQRLRGELRSTAREGYTVHEIDAADGMVIKEYVAPDGMVFGVSWQGPTMPDLQHLLGTYFLEFQQSTQGAAPRRRSLAMRTERLVVESGGHMRSFHGRAFVPNLLPGGVREEVVQ